LYEDNGMALRLGEEGKSDRAVSRYGVGAVVKCSTVEGKE